MEAGGAKGGTGGPNGNAAVVATSAERVDTEEAGQATEVLRYCDFRDFIRHLGIDPLVDASGLVMVAAHDMFAAPLPPHWSEQIDESSSRVYFFNTVTGDSMWMHPQEALYRELIADVRSWRPDEPLEDIFARSDAHLRRAQQQAVEAIAQWSAFDVPQGPEEAPEFGDMSQFYFNSTTGESRWADPRQSVEFDLRQRHSILCKCIAAHSQVLARMGSSDSSDAEEVRQPGSNVQTLVQTLLESLGTLPLPTRQSAMPPTDVAPPQGVRRPSNLPAGDETVRSSISYFSARSTTSCRGEGGDPDLPPVDPPASHPFVLQTQD